MATLTPSLCTQIESAYASRDYETIRTLGKELSKKTAKAATTSDVVKRCLGYYNTCRELTTSLRKHIARSCAIENSAESYEALSTIAHPNLLPPMERFDLYYRTVAVGQIYQKSTKLKLEGSSTEVDYEFPKPDLSNALTEGMKLYTTTHPHSTDFGILCLKARVLRWSNSHYESMPLRALESCWTMCGTHEPDFLWPLEIKLILAGFADDSWLNDHLEDINKLTKKCRANLFPDNTYRFLTSFNYASLCIIHLEERAETLSGVRNHPKRLRNKIKYLSTYIKLGEPLDPCRLKLVNDALTLRSLAYNHLGQQQEALEDLYQRLHLRIIVPTESNNATTARAFIKEDLIEETQKLIMRLLQYSMDYPESAFGAQMLTTMFHEHTALLEPDPKACEASGAGSSPSSDTVVADSVTSSRSSSSVSPTTDFVTSSGVSPPISVGTSIASPPPREDSPEFEPIIEVV